MLKVDTVTANFQIYVIAKLAAVLPNRLSGMSRKRGIVAKAPISSPAPATISP